ncbi:MAG: peptidoglycan DD-metalloendopeptidase family protein [Paludibacteraceae bacterium]|nr:peptidoglycan DD-metalloendopeptidase family protein [Paludibacteraceae bacterium]
MKRIIGVFILVLLSSSVMMSQTVSELQARKKKALENLELTSSLIEKTSKSKTKTLTQLNLLNAEIKQRQTVINTLNAEIRGINKDLNKLRNETNKLQQELDTLKKEYAVLMYHTYFKKSKYEELMFVLSAKDFSESFRRYRYIKQYSEYCQKKTEEINTAKAALTEKLQKTEKIRAERLSVLNERKKENTKLQNEKNKQDKLVKDLKKKERQLKAELKKQQKLANKLNEQIEKKIAEEAKKSSKPSSSGSGKTYALTKEEKLLSGNFEKNQGRLPWPVLKGIVVGHFGIHPHPVLKHVTTNNKGIYIQCPKGSQARAVFDGEVTQTFSIAGSNKTVIIKHGIYRTVYSNLSKVTVKVGDKVKTKDNIGTIYSDPEDGDKTELYFQVWKDRNIHNPENWLAK